MAIFQNFIKIDETDHLHLTPLMPMIQDACFTYIDFYISKARDFQIEEALLPVIISLNDACATRFKDSVLKAAQSDFLSMHPHVAEKFVNIVHLEFQEDAEKILIPWIKNNFLCKAKKSRPAYELALGSMLRLNGIENIEYELNNHNETTLITQCRALMGIARNSWTLSDELLGLVLTAFALAMEHEKDSVSDVAIKGISSLFKNYSYKVRGCTSTRRFNLLAAKNEYPTEYKWVIPELVNPQRTQHLISTVFLETIAICENLMLDIFQGRALQVPEELYVEQLFAQNLKRITKSDIKMFHIKETKFLELGLSLLVEILNKDWIQLVQLRSNKLRGVIDTFRKKLTFFLVKSNQYSNPRLREAYLLLYHVNNVMASHISNGNKNTEKLWDLNKSVLLNIKKANFHFKSELASSILRDYLPINNYCQYHKWTSVDELILDHPLFATYNLDAYGNNPDKFFWIFSQELCDYLFNKVITVFFRQIILFLQHFESSELLAEVKNLVNGSWINFSSTDLIQFLLWTLLNVLSMDHMSETYFNKTVIYAEIALETCLGSYTFTDEHTVFTLLQIGRQIINNGTYVSSFKVYYNLIQRILGWAEFPPEQDLSHMTKLLEIMDNKSDEETSLVDLLEVTTRFLIYHRSWDLEFRANLLEYIMSHINSKDINKRAIYLGFMSFMNRTLRRTDYIFKEVNIKHDKFLNQNGYIDMYMLKEAFRQIRFNIGYTDENSTIFNQEQLDELEKITGDCVPAVTFPQFLTLPFKALTFEISEKSTAQYFQNNLMKLGATQKYEEAIVDFIVQLINEYSEEVDDKGLLVGYNYAEVLIDTKKLFKFDKNIQIFSTLKVFCQFLGLDTIKEIFRKLEQQNEKQNFKRSDYAKVILGFYSSLLAAAAYYTEAEFIKVLEMGKPILKQFFNVINAKFLENFIVHLNKALRGNLSYKQLKLFFTMFREMMEEDSQEHYVFYLNILIFEITISQMLLTDDLIHMFKKILNKCQLNDINSANIISRMFRSIFSVRMLISFNDVFIKHNTRILTEDTISSTIYDRDKVDFDSLVLEYLSNLRECKSWVKLEGIKHIFLTCVDKKITSNNIPMLKKLFKILFAFTPGTDFVDSSLVPAYRGVIMDIRNTAVAQRHIKDNIMVLLKRSWEDATAYECFKGILMIMSIGYNRKMTEKVHEMIRENTQMYRLNMHEEIMIANRDELLVHLSDNELWDYADQVYTETEPLIEKM